MGRRRATEVPWWITAERIVEEAQEYKCPACPAKFDKLADKKRHMREAHR